MGAPPIQKNLCTLRVGPSYNRFMTLEYVVVKDSEGWYIASVPTMPGCYTASRTEEDLEERIAEAATIHLQFMGAEGKHVMKFEGVRSVTL